MFRGLLSRRAQPDSPREASTGGALIYAVGDIHGRSDLLDLLMPQIREDIAREAEGRQPAIIFVGDYVDRGLDSRGVVERLIALKAEPGLDVRLLKGNHELQLLAFLKDASVGPAWGQFGGAATLASYGVTPPADRSIEAWEVARQAFTDQVSEHLAFYQDLELAVECGDYVFVHAGIRPGVPLARQVERDLLWIRDPFLESMEPFERVVVHGHTPEVAPYLGRNRIGIDTGAYATSTLTAIRLSGEGRHVIQATLSGRK